MRILIANTDCKFGGVTTFMLALQSALRERGHGCGMFFFQDGPMREHLPADASAHFGSLTDLLRLVDRERIDVVQANNIDWFTGISAVRRLGARLVLTAHKVRAPVYTHGWTSRECDAFVAVSQWIREALQPFTDVPIQAVPNGIDTHRFYPGSHQDGAVPIVAWVGRGGAARKRLQAFAEITPALRRAGARIWVIDPHGPETLAIEHPTAAATLRETAEVWHGVSSAEMPDIYRQVAASLGCVVSTASMEGLPLTLLEAQACGCVVVAPDVLGINECVSAAQGGVLYPFEMPAEALAALVVQTIADRAAVRDRQHAAASHVKAHFSLERMAERYLAVYRDAPFPAAGTTRARVRARARFSPVLQPGGYVAWRWGVGERQYDVSKELAGGGQWPLAAAAARASLRAAPTMYLKPARLTHLLRTQWHGGFRTDARHRRSPIPIRGGSEPI
jgi:glycosyltransferase involved in cell wall biosynthesis